MKKRKTCNFFNTLSALFFGLSAIVCVFSEANGVGLSVSVVFTLVGLSMWTIGKISEY